jgi:2-oxoisovalerate dehydrogenase E2 component (dihydrolipoyl transacylase)
MPQLRESIHEGTIGRWLKQPGEQVEKYEALVEIITDKVNAEIPSPIDGTLTAILAPAGTTVDIGAVIGEMEETKETLSDVVLNPNGTAIKAASDVAPIAEESEPTGSFPAGRAVAGWYEEKSILDDTGEDDPPEKPHRYSPAVRRLAEEHQLDLTRLNLKGSGLGGRITREDVLNYLEQQRPVRPEQIPAKVSEPAISNPAAQTGFQPVLTAAMQIPMEPDPPHLTKPFPVESRKVEPIAPPVLVSQPPLAPASVIPLEVRQVPPSVVRPIPEPIFTEEMFERNGEEVQALTPMRKAIAEHLTRSKQTTPHAWTMVEVDMTRLVQFRTLVKEDFKRQEGLSLTYLPFIIQAVVKGLRQFPQLNATWMPERGGIVVKRELNLGVAIDVPDGLIVPVIQRADEKSLLGLTRNLHDLITRAREKKLTLADVQGGTFTVNNPGAFGSVLSYPIINQPQAGILTMEAIVKRPVVLTDAAGNDAIAIRSMMNMCLSFDHRVVDGAIVGRFLQFVKQWLEKETPKLD